MSEAPFSRTSGNIFQTIIPGKPHRINFNAAAQSTIQFELDTTVVEIFATKDCWLKFSYTPTAAADDGASIPVPGGLKLTYGVRKGYRCSVIRDTADGVIDIIEGANQ